MELVVISGIAFFILVYLYEIINTYYYQKAEIPKLIHEINSTIDKNEFLALEIEKRKNDISELDSFRDSEDKTEYAMLIKKNGEKSLLPLSSITEVKRVFKNKR